MENMACHGNHCGYCGCMHHKMVPAAVLLIGLSMLLKEAGAVSVSFNAYAIAILLIAIGLVKLMSGKCKCYENK